VTRAKDLQSPDLIPCQIGGELIGLRGIVSGSRGDWIRDKDHTGRLTRSRVDAETRTGELLYLRGRGRGSHATTMNSIGLQPKVLRRHCWTCNHHGSDSRAHHFTYSCKGWYAGWDTGNQVTCVRPNSDSKTINSNNRTEINRSNQIRTP
jgi:hypothetical protein